MTPAARRRPAARAQAGRNGRAATARSDSGPANATLADPALADPALAGTARAALGWARDHALPLWLERGLDRRRGGFHEELDHERLESAAPFRRLRAATRQVYVFAAGMRLGLAGAREGLDHGLAFLLGPARHPEGGFANRFDLEGRTIDATRDLYDLAFAGLALAHAHKATGEAALVEEARALAAFLSREMRHPAGGFREALEAPLGLRRQNPHMHLLEAALAWVERDPGGPWDDLARDLGLLFRIRLHGGPACCLPEYFDEDLRPLRAGQQIKPGHLFEWIWLLHRADRLGILPRGEEAEVLRAFALARGIGPDGLPRGALAITGAPLADPVRLWAATEWVKAEAVSAAAGGETGELAGAGDRAVRVARAWGAVERFLAAPRPGLWHERWDPAAPPGPGSELGPELGPEPGPGVQTGSGGA